MPEYGSDDEFFDKAGKDIRKGKVARPFWYIAKFVLYMPTHSTGMLIIFAGLDTGVNPNCNLLASNEEPQSLRSARPSAISSSWMGVSDPII